MFLRLRLLFGGCLATSRTVALESSDSLVSTIALGYSSVLVLVIVICVPDLVIYAEVCAPSAPERHNLFTA